MRRYPVPAIVVVGGGRYLMELVDLPLKKKKKEDDEAGRSLGSLGLLNMWCTNLKYDWKISLYLHKTSRSFDLLLGAILGAQQQIKVIGESLDLVKYVDSNFEGPSLLPDDPEKRKFAEELIAYSDTTFVPKVYRPFTRDARTLSGEI
ncbi:hypothetical protein KY284_037544 [Solanum tuberosum]|nr:hypothetical protein KY284_037544 [Solanum tuberosum]